MTTGNCTNWVYSFWVFCNESTSTCAISFISNSFFIAQSLVLCDCWSFNKYLSHNYSW